MNRFIKTLIAALLLLGSAGANAENTPTDIVNATIFQLFKMNNTKVLCLTSKSSLAAIRTSVQAQLSKRGITTSANANDIARATYTVFPCPFSPYRSELRPATKQEIEGVWLYPETSQKLRYGPNSPLWKKHLGMPLKCESVAYYPDGETRNVQITGDRKCNISHTRDMQASRSNPKVASWKMIGSGKVKISRTDVPDHIEEWEIFSVAKPFTMAKVRFNKGDLLAYLRKVNGNNFNVATMFRHLRRLP